MDLNHFSFELYGQHSAAGLLVPDEGILFDELCLRSWKDKPVGGGSYLWVSVSHSLVQMAQEIISFVYSNSLSSLSMLYLKS